MFSQTVEYAMRAMLALATDSSKPMTTKHIAEAMCVPPSYLSKVLQSLVRAGLVYSTRGIKGGFVLVKAPGELSLLEIVNSVNPIQRIESCPLDIRSHSSNLCPLHRRLDEAMAMVEKAFAETTLAEILSEENPCATLQRQLKILHANFGPDEPQTLT